MQSSQEDTYVVQYNITPGKGVFFSIDRYAMVEVDTEGDVVFAGTNIIASEEFRVGESSEPFLNWFVAVVMSQAALRQVVFVVLRGQVADSCSDEDIAALVDGWIEALKPRPVSRAALN